MKNSDDASTSTKTPDTSRAPSGGAAETIDYATLSPDTVIDAVEATGRISDARVIALNSYENRVYQVGIEDALPVIVKFYRPLRWSDAQILEEHAFCAELCAAELPIVAPLADANGNTLFHYAGFRYALFARKGGQAPEAGDAEQSHRIGMLLGRMHAVARTKPFAKRHTLDIPRFLDRPAGILTDHGFVPPAFAARYSALIADLRVQLTHAFDDARANDVAFIRTQGDCHPGNIVWTRDDGPWFVDFDDCQSAPAVQDMWMMLAGDRNEREATLAELLDGYTAFCDFNVRELRLIEPLRTLRLAHYAGWIAERWEDPAFPRAFPWFNTPRWWQSHLGELEEQRRLLDEEPLRCLTGW